MSKVLAILAAVLLVAGCGLRPVVAACGRVVAVSLNGVIVYVEGPYEGFYLVEEVKFMPATVAITIYSRSGEKHRLGEARWAPGVACD